MTDADLIYNACLRAERLFEERETTSRDGGDKESAMMFKLAGAVVMVLRVEIGTGLAKERR